MIWITRQFALDGWFDVQEAFDAVWQEAGSPPDMMMIGRNEGGLNKRIYISLLDTSLIPNFPGFEGIDIADLPEAPSLLVGNGSEFMRRFRNGID